VTAGSEQVCYEGGIVQFLKEVGQKVSRDAVVAIIRCPYGDTLEEVRAPVAGWITAYPLRANQAAMSGDTIAFFVHRKS
jgi:predicted deacylase